MIIMNVSGNMTDQLWYSNIFAQILFKFQQALKTFGYIHHLFLFAFGQSTSVKHSPPLPPTPAFPTLSSNHFFMLKKFKTDL